MKSTPYETRFYYATGHAANPLLDKSGQPAKVQPDVSAPRKIGGFQFTEGAMQLTLPAHKSQRNAKFLERTHGVKSEVIKRVDVPTRSRSYSPKSEAEGILGLVDESASGTEGQEANGAGAAGASAPDAASLEAIRRGASRTGAKRGSSVASSTPVDPATRAKLLGNGPGADAVKSADVNADDLT